MISICFLRSEYRYSHFYLGNSAQWGLADSASCECGEPEQTAVHIIYSCPLHRPPSEAGLFEVCPLIRAWVQQTELTI